MREMEKITFRNWYNGTPRDWHTVTPEFFERMKNYIAKHPKWDVETEIYIGPIRKGKRDD